MKIINKLIIILLTVIFCTLTSTAQNFKKSLQYKIRTETIYGVPYKTDFMDLGEYEIAGMLNPVANESFEFNIDDNNLVTIIHNHLDRPRFNDDYVNELAQSVTNENGTVLYDHNGDEIPITGDIDPSTIIYLEDHEVAEYGIYNSTFARSFTDVCNVLLQQGFQIRYNYNQRLVKARKNDAELMIDYDNYTIEDRYYQNNVLNKASTYIFQDYNGIIIPLARLYTSYDTINNIRVQKLILRHYLSYSIFEYGENVLEWHNKVKLEDKQDFSVGEYKEVETEFSFQVYPNPAAEYVNVEVLNSEGREYSVEIFDISGKKVFEKRGLSDNTVRLDLSQFQRGSYVVTCSLGGDKESMVVIVN